MTAWIAFLCGCCLFASIYNLPWLFDSFDDDTLIDMVTYDRLCEGAQTVLWASVIATVPFLVMSVFSWTR